MLPQKSAKNKQKNTALGHLNKQHSITTQFFPTQPGGCVWASQWVAIKHLKLCFGYSLGKKEVQVSAA